MTLVQTQTLDQAELSRDMPVAKTAKQTLQRCNLIWCHFITHQK